MRFEHLRAFYEALGEEDSIQHPPAAAFTAAGLRVRQLMSASGRKQPCSLAGRGPIPRGRSRRSAKINNGRLPRILRRMNGRAATGLSVALLIDLLARAEDSPLKNTFQFARLKKTGGSGSC
ncbi:hypothetical protein WG922_17405 [Ramlibacter sp. AN1015]|uniref:hypothetical protein n=1 Tax=Ramlibacter sp. AN1015 TaxID=3133428 RepID=UPI0030C2C5C1